MASSSAILPGPMRSPLVKSRRMLKRMSAMDAARLQRLRPEHREFAAFVKSCGPAAPRTRRHCGRRSHSKRPCCVGNTKYLILYSGGPVLQRAGVLLMKHSDEEALDKSRC